MIIACGSLASIHSLILDNLKDEGEERMVVEERKLRVKREWWLKEREREENTYNCVTMQQSQGYRPLQMCMRFTNA